MSPERIWLLGRRSRSGITGHHAAAYVLAQLASGIIGAWLANVMFDRRMFSDTFAGIAPSSAPGFVATQIVGGLIGLALVAVLYPDAADTADNTVIPHGWSSR